MCTRRTHHEAELTFANEAEFQGEYQGEYQGNMKGSIRGVSGRNRLRNSNGLQ
jgi:hypothetical protein